MSVNQPGLPASTGRLRCPRCQRPAPTCLCPWVTPTANEVEVLILQHPLEVHQAKGSARLLQLSLQRCTLQVGEVFDAAALQAWLEAPGEGMRNLLLYPQDPPRHSAQTCARHGQGEPQATSPSSCLPPSNAVHGAPATRLIVLDGTWRKSRKMLALNPLLQALPRLALTPTAPSRYLIRKAHQPGQLATLEATCLALSQLEGFAARYAPLLAAFERHMAAQAARLAMHHPHRIIESTDNDPEPLTS